MELVVTYDISNNKLRTNFAKFLDKYGNRVQYSVFEIKASQRVLDLIKARINGHFKNGHFKNRFAKTDSIRIYQTDINKTIKYGYAADDDKDFLYL